MEDKTSNQIFDWQKELVLLVNKLSNIGLKQSDIEKLSESEQLGVLRYLRSIEDARELQEVG